MHGERKEKNGSDSGQRGVVPGQCVRVVEESARVTIPGQAAAMEPRVQLIREDGVIRAIEVICSCGQRIRLRCLFKE